MSAKQKIEIAENYAAANNLPDNTLEDMLRLSHVCGVQITAADVCEAYA